MLKISVVNILELVYMYIPWAVTVSFLNSTMNVLTKS